MSRRQRGSSLDKKNHWTNRLQRRRVLKWLRSSQSKKRRKSRKGRKLIGMQPMHSSKRLLGVTALRLVIVCMKPSLRHHGTELWRGSILQTQDGGVDSQRNSLRRLLMVLRSGLPRKSLVDEWLLKTNKFTIFMLRRRKAFLQSRLTSVERCSLQVQSERTHCKNKIKRLSKS